MNRAQPEPKLTAIPKVPREFGEDGGHFYERYDALTEEFDEDLVKRLKSQLDSTLIFAGLFAGVNSAFLAITLPSMRADPADDTNALLLQLVTSGNSTIRSADDLPSATFTPASGIVPVNILFSLCLLLAIVIALFCILGQQWLVYYCKRSGGGIEHRRWEQLQRYLGAERWGLTGLLDDFLPILLQLGILIFGVAFTLYLQTLNKTVYTFVSERVSDMIDLIKLFWAHLRLPRKPTAISKAVAVKRVLCTSRDFNTLIYTAINIQAINQKKGARHLLQDDAVRARLEELVNSPDTMLSSAFVCAFSHLLLGVQDVRLFVKPAHRYLYFLSNPLWEPHPLKKRVEIIYNRLSTYIDSLDMRPDTLVETLLYFELLKLILDEEAQKEELSKWVDRVIQKQQPAKVSSLFVICLVADTVRILNEGIESADAASGVQTAPQGSDSEQEERERLRQHQGRVVVVQGQRVGLVKKLVRAVGWQMKLVPSKSKRDSALELIERAFDTDNSQSLRQPDMADVWLLEQALLVSTSNRHDPGWKFVAERSVGLLRSFDTPGDPTPDSVSSQGSQKDNRRRCAKILSQCIQAARDHLVPDESIRTVSPALRKLVNYWDKFKDDFTQNPDLRDSDMLSSWFEIRGALDRPDESTGWGAHNLQPFGEAYPSLKIGFDTIASVMSDNAPRVDQNRTKHPRDSACDGKAGQTEPDEAIADPNTPKPDEHIGHSREGLGESREHEDAREPNSGERNEQPEEQAGHANSTPI
ncbi:hypothetical protein FRC00_001152 [Tulasnella sp. 408]|nr:hypothetical protein FRC00_001152 [Tulasnella sp. 408]